MNEINILFDSGCDISEEMARELGFDIVPLTVRVGEDIFVDDYNLKVDKLRESLRAVTGETGTACPSPDDFKSKFNPEKGNFVVTLSQKLSGSYNSANVAKKIYEEEEPGAYVDIIDSETAACGEALITLELKRLSEMGLTNEEISAEIRRFVLNMKTYFIIDSMDNLIKTGRVSTFKGRVAQFLSIVPIMKANRGEIELEQKVRGSKNAFARLVEIVGENSDGIEDKILGISHCNAYEKAKDFKEEIRKRYKFKDIMIFETRGIATFYAGEGGLIVSY